MFGARFSAISIISRVVANFALKFPNFRYHSNKDQTGVKFNDILKLPDLGNPVFGAPFSAISLI